MKKYEGYALITGGGSGIGLAFANELAAKGYNLVLVDKNEVALNTQSEKIKKAYSIDIISIAQDLATLDAVDRIYNELQNRKIPIGLLINNAGFSLYPAFFAQNPRDQFQEQIKVMVLGLADLTYKLLPEMLERGTGGIIFISSLSAFCAFPFASIYGACKAFSLKLGINLHAEYSRKGIDILTVCPGGVDTNIWPPGTKPTTRLIDPAELAKEALHALGKKVVLTLTSTFSEWLFLKFLPGILSYKISEKIISNRLKRLIFRSKPSHHAKRK